MWNIKSLFTFVKRKLIKEVGNVNWNESFGIDHRSITIRHRDIEDMQENKAIPIWIGLFEASAIATELEKLFSPGMNSWLF